MRLICPAIRSIITFTATLYCVMTVVCQLQAEVTPGPLQGFNLGNALEAPEEGKWGVTLKEDYFTTIAQKGFHLIRIPISWPAHAQKEVPYTIDPTFFQRVDWALGQAKANHLVAILDLHNYGALMKDPAGEEARYLGIWKQVAEHYQAQPATVYFELLNEPNEKLDAAMWNQLLIKALAVIRPTNPNRTIVVGGVHWNSIGALADLVLPEDDHSLLVTFHYYDPIKFTHQGASWMQGSAAWMGTTWQGTDAEKRKVDQDMDKAAAWGKTHSRPIYMGEFGSYEKGDPDSRVRWTQYVARSADAHGFSWTYWEFCSGFGAYDPVKNQWREPLLEALMPPTKL